MKKNMGMADRMIRILLAAMIILLYRLHVISGTIAVVLLLIGGVFLLTSFLSFCPLYTLLGIKTCKLKKTT